MAPDRTEGAAEGPQPKLGARLQSRFLKPAKPGSDDGWDIPTDVAELEAAYRGANDKERIVGLFGAPIAAAIAILVVRILAHDNPAQYLQSGATNPKYLSVTLLNELLVVSLGLSLLILGFALWRKRLLLGIAFALYGLSIFNLHQYGFGIPFILAGAWLLVRSYRLSHGLKMAAGGFDAGARPSGRPRANKRYTPPVKR